MPFTAKTPFFPFLCFSHFVNPRMVKTRAGVSFKKRSAADAKVVASTSKRQKAETPPPPSLATSPVASPVAIEAMKPKPPAIPKGMWKKARAVKSSETLSSHPNSPLPKSPLSSLSKKMASPYVATSGVVGSPIQPTTQPSSPLRPTKPFSSK